MKFNFLIKAFALFCLAFVPFAAFAGVNVVPPSTEAPFDGGLSILLAAGIGYASKKAYDKRKKNKLQNGMDK